MKKGLTQVGDFQVGKFVLVKIHPAASKMDRKIPQLPANGRTAIVKRGEIVPLSLAHFSSLESAKVPYYSEQGGGTPDNPTKGRKLLGYRQRVTYSNYSLGVRVDTLVELLNAADGVIAEYNIKKILNDANAVIGEIHQWDATTYPGPI